MFRYENVKCPVCGNELTEQEDIVVCPECGAPHHRDCWMKQGACFYKDKHGTPDSWQMPEEPPKGLRCPHCGTINAGNEKICNDCGGTLSDAEPVEYGQIPQQSPPIPFNIQADFGIPKTENLGDATVEEVTSFVGPNAIYYIKKFFLISKLNKLGSFNFSALLFPGLWMLFRKMYLKGSIVTGLVYGLELLAIYIDLKWAMPLLDSLYSRAGMSTGAYDMNSILKLSQEMMTLSAQEILIMLLPTIIFFITMGISIYICVMGNKMYYNHTMEKIRSIRAKHTEKASLHSELRKAGNVNIFIVMSVGISYYIISALMELYISKI